MKKIIILIMVLLTFTKADSQILNPGDGVFTFSDSVYYFVPGVVPKDLVLEVLRTRNTAAAAPNLGSIANPALTWSSFMYYDKRWTASNLGKIFGVTIDNNRNIFVSATGFFGQQITGKSTGAIYRIDGITGAPTPIKDLNPGGAITDFALGNIKFYNGYLYVSNLKDGKIYSILATSPYTTIATYTPTGWSTNDKPCGLAIRNVGGLPRLFFSRNGFNSSTTKIYSIDLLAGGLFGVSQNLEINTPFATNNEDPVTDIAFSKDGNQIILAQKTMAWGATWNFGYGQIGTAHASTVNKFTFSSGTWSNIPAPNFQVGYGIGSRNCAGGLSFSDFQINQDGKVFCDTTIYATSDAITFGNTLPPVPTNTLCYGVTGFDNKTGAGSSTGINIDANNDLNGSIWKGHYGDIEMLSDAAPCKEACPCQQTLSPYLLWNELSPSSTGQFQQLKIKTIDIKCGETYTDRLSCYIPYSIQVANPCGENCEPDEVITTIKFTPAAGSGLTGYIITGGTLTANLPGKYEVTIKVKCNGVWCKDCKITFIQTKKCEPPCNNCKVDGVDKVKAGFNPATPPTSYTVGTYPAATSLNAAFVLGGGADTYTQIRANIVDIQLKSDNPACLQCYNTPNQWGSILGGDLAGFTSAVTTYPSVPTISGNNNPREIVFNTTTPTAIPMMTAMNLNLQLPGVSPLSCCCIHVTVFVKITFRNNKCEECSKVIKIEFDECGPKGDGQSPTGTLNFGGHPQMRQHVPSVEDGTLLSPINPNAKSN